MANEKMCIYPENSDGNEKCEITVPFLDYFAHIFVTKDALVHSLVREVNQKYPIHPEITREYARGIHFFLSFSPEFYNKINQNPYESASTKIITPLKRALNIQSESPGNPSLDTAFNFGWVFALDENNISCVINIEKIARAVSQNKTEYFHLPSHASEEAKQASFAQAIDSVWSRDQQNLIHVLLEQRGISNIEEQQQGTDPYDIPAYSIVQPIFFKGKSPFLLTFEK